MSSLLLKLQVGEVMEVAKANGLAAHDIAEPTLWVNDCGNAFYKDVPNSTPMSAQEVLDTSVQAADPRALSKTFKLNSKKSATRTIYLDFNGAKVKKTEWNKYVGMKRIDAFPYSLDADPNFSEAELVQIQQIWLGVAEDYAPFNVNVTTKKPKAANLARSSKRDKRWGLTVLVTAGANPLLSKCQCGGIAYLNRAKTKGKLFNRLNYAWTFTGDGSPYSGSGFYSSDLANTSSHETGHNYGLKHDGYNGAEYTEGANPWGPLMGAPYGRYVTQWSKGEYAGATNRKQNDLKVIANSVGKRKDDYPNSAKKANRLKKKKAKKIVLKAGKSRNGYIASTSDKDVFRLKQRGTFTVSAIGNFYGNLDVQLSLLDRKGRVLATVNPGTGETAYGTGTGLSADLPISIADTDKKKYFVRVDGAGQGDPAALGGYSGYGSLGEYLLVVR